MGKTTGERVVFRSVDLYPRAVPIIAKLQDWDKRARKEGDYSVARALMLHAMRCEITGEHLSSRAKGNPSVPFLLPTIHARLDELRSEQSVRGKERIDKIGQRVGELTDALWGDPEPHRMTAELLKAIVLRTYDPNE